MNEITDVLTGRREETLEAMLPPWIIEQIRKREEERPKDDRPALRLPIEEPEPDYKKRECPDGEDEDRGVVVIELYGYKLKK